uniref:Putative secreted protein n=1 Tax=Ixodes ricinus TaxID=34613 RepID=A0A6B0UTZ9_IXORI
MGTRRPLCGILSLSSSGLVGCSLLRRSSLPPPIGCARAACKGGVVGCGVVLEVCKLLGTLLGRRDAQGLFLILVKVARVSRAFALGDEGSLHLLLVDGDPVGGGEPLVVLDVVDPVLEVAKALGQVHLKQVPQQVLQVRREV